MVMTACVGVADAARDRLPVLWRAIEDAHYSYLETDDSPEKIQQRKKLEGYIMDYLSLVPHECKFGLPETAKVFQRTITETDFSAYRAGLGWAALARYAGNLLAQPWRKEYRTIRLYCGYYKHEVEANIVGADTLLHAMGYRPCGPGKLQLTAPICPDMVTAISRDAIIAHCECQIMCEVWEGVVNLGCRASWTEVARERAKRAGSAAASISRLVPTVPQTVPTPIGNYDDTGIYTNVSATTSTYQNHIPDTRRPYNQYQSYPDEQPIIEEPIVPMIQSYMVPPTMVQPTMVPPTMVPPNLVYHVPCDVPTTSTVPMTYVPYYYGQPYMVPAPMYQPIKQANNIPINGYSHRCQVPTGQLIELDTSYENGKNDDRTRRRESRRNSTSKSGFSDVSLPSLPRSDTQPVLNKAREDGMGTFESWDYVFRNLSSKEQERDSRSRVSPSDRDSRTLDRLDREERRAKYQPTTLDLEDGLHALSLDRSYDDEVYRTAKVNENLRIKQELEVKKAKIKQDEKKKRVVEQTSVNSLVPSDKMRLMTKKDVKDRKEVLKQQSFNGNATTVDLKKPKKTKVLTIEVEKPKSKVIENGHNGTAQAPKIVAGTSSQNTNIDLKTQLVVSLDETDCKPQKKLNGHQSTDKWECTTCTYINKSSINACEMCGKSKRTGPEIQPLTSGGKECPACTLVNNREARICDACGTGLEHCPTYI